MEKGKSPTPAGGRGAFLARHLDFAGMVWSGRQQGVAMRLLGNILWHFPCFGFVTSLFSFLAGILLTVTVVGAPIGLGLIHCQVPLAPYSYSMMTSGIASQ
ncbi:MAG: YccF domain-containing protein [Bilophila wadsworthia]